MQSSAIITPQKLATIGSDVINQSRTADSANPADEAVSRLVTVLQTSYGVNATQAYAPINGQDHTVVAVPAEDTTHKKNKGHFIVDPTIRNYQDVLYDSVPDVAVLSPSDVKSCNWYDIPPQVR